MVVKRKPTGRKGTRATTRYVVNATFRMRSLPKTKAGADKIAKSVKRKGGTVIIKKV